MVCVVAKKGTLQKRGLEGPRRPLFLLGGMVVPEEG